MQPQAMYNPALFSIRQEFQMPAKKAASKKRKKASVSRKHTAANRVSKTKVTKKKVAKKKVSKKKIATKKVSKKKPAKKSASKKKASQKKVVKKVSKKKPAAKKKAASKKKPSAKKKAVSKKKPSAKKKAVSKKKAAPVRKTASKKVARKSRPRGDVLSGPIHGISPYKPRRGEEYMSAEQLEHFHKILTAWKTELMYEVDRTVHHMQDEAANFPDPNDRATQESEFGLELRTRDRERKLLRKIESALSRIEEGSYGYCDETGEEIGLKRLEARPVATLCLEAQERRELAERQFRDRDDRYR
jgi:DnaK suppressor protein